MQAIDGDVHAGSSDGTVVTLTKVPPPRRRSAALPPLSLKHTRLPHPGRQGGERRRLVFDCPHDPPQVSDIRAADNALYAAYRCRAPSHAPSACAAVALTLGPRPGGVQFPVAAALPAVRRSRSTPRPRPRPRSSSTRPPALASIHRQPEATGASEPVEGAVPLIGQPRCFSRGLAPDSERGRRRRPAGRPARLCGGASHAAGSLFRAGAQCARCALEIRPGERSLKSAAARCGAAGTARCGCGSCRTRW